MPIKIEKEQLDRKITKININELKNIYTEIYKIINIKTLKKIATQTNTKEKV